MNLRKKNELPNRKQNRTNKTSSEREPGSGEHSEQLYNLFICVCVLQYTQFSIHKVASNSYLVKL
jgi:hypothetical protein